MIEPSEELEDSNRLKEGAMDKVIVACVQQGLRLHADLDASRKDLARFLRMAQAKKAKLIVFPELIGTMAVPPLLPGLRLTCGKT
jgi:predicted amidohydrolase